MIEEAGYKALDQLSTKIRPKKAYKTNREDLRDPGPYKMVGKKKGCSIQELTNKLSDILTDPKKYKKYQHDLTKYTWEQAGMFGYRGTLVQFLSTLC